MSLGKPFAVFNRILVLPSPNAQLLILLVLAALLRLIWTSYTNYTYEDAFITFRYARNLSAGYGMVYNLGEHVYGTTTPLFTILLAGWLTFVSSDVVLGARLIGLTAAIITLVALWLLLARLGVEHKLSLFALAVLALSDKLWERDMGGMETPLVILLMTITWYASTKSHFAVAGIASGLLLWTRIDTVFWVIALGIAVRVSQPNFPYRLILLAGLIYLPWLVFATAYFGSPLPNTLIAKWAAYHLADAYLVWPKHVITILNWLTPVTIPSEWGVGQLVVGLITMLIAVWGAISIRQLKLGILLPVFFVIEFMRLVLTGVTFEPRYFVPLYWTTLVLCGLGLGRLWNKVSIASWPVQRTALGALLVVLVIGFGLSTQRTQVIGDYQHYVYDSSLKPLGRWLSENTPPDSTVLLEPLGYAGYYSNRYMIDQVGLVSPQITAFNTQRANVLTIVLSLKPDYGVFHCDDILVRLGRADVDAIDFSRSYSNVATFNPLNFDARNTSGISFSDLRLRRNACYEIWQRSPIGQKTLHPITGMEHR